MDHRRIYPHDRVGRRHFGIEIQMSIDIRGRRNIAVTQPFLDFFQADPVCIQQTRAAIHTHCLLQFAPFKNLVLENYEVTAFHHCNYVNIGLNSILKSDRIMLTNGGYLLKEVAERLRSLRESVKLSQVKMAEIVGVKQSSLNRYELNQASPTFETLTRYADYFDVSMDYIFGRTDNPQGKLYEYKPKIQQNDPQMQKFVEMCFDPTSPMNARLKETLLQMLGEAKQ